MHLEPNTQSELHYIVGKHTALNYYYYYGFVVRVVVIIVSFPVSSYYSLYCFYYMFETDKWHKKTK